jgi:uncharacterized protein YlxW (UPF0749 family)
VPRLRLGWPMRRSAMPSAGSPDRPPSRWRYGVPLVFAAAGLLFSTSAETARGTNLRSDETVAHLDDVIRQTEQRNDDRRAHVAVLRAEIDAISGGLASDEQVARAQRDARAMEPAAGLRPVTGRGLTVTLDDAPPEASKRTYPQGLEPTPDDLVVHQQDLQAVVNALWAGGAEGIKLMDQRIISTSAVRCVGNTLILQDRVYSPPYVVTAVGDPDRMRETLGESQAVEYYLEAVDLYGLGWRVAEHSRTTVPAYSESVELRYAEVGKQ